ncbi:MAG TPA: hypothetical protein VKB51_07220 [bacterium]|nr:hypothetical protein [bacterium]
MSERDWKQEYERACTAAGTGRACRAFPGAEKRRHPRLHTKGLRLQSAIAAGLAPIDVRPDRIEFFAEVPMQPGQRFSLRREAGPPSDVEVVACLLEETDADLLEVRYRVCCRLLSPRN